MNFLLALLTAALLVLTFPRFDFAFLAPLALTPLLIAAARELRPMRRFWIGYAAGVVYWFGVCYWIQFVLAVHGGMGNATAWAVFTLFCLAKALQMGLFAVLAGIAIRRAWAVPAVAALWVVIEWTHAHTGFTWLVLGNAASDMSIPMRLAPWTGVSGLSFVFMMMSTALALALLRRPRAQLLWLGAVVLLPMLPGLPAAKRGDATAILVQPNLRDDQQWTRQSTDDLEQRLVILSLGPVLSRQKPIDFVVWPEVPAPLYDDDRRFNEVAADLAKTAKSHFLTGVVARASDGAPLNSAILFSPQGRKISRYDKVNLVPFGEFVPWPLGALTKKISTEAGDFESGHAVVVPAAGAHRIGTFICYESVFPNFIRQFAANGAEVLFNLSNDSWFGKSAARYQHLKIVRMRAAENRRWILRATNNGITASIDPAGRLIYTGPSYEEIAARVTYSYATSTTPYTRFGDWFVLLCLAGACFSLWFTNAGLRVRLRPLRRTPSLPTEEDPSRAPPDTPSNPPTTSSSPLPHE